MSWFKVDDHFSFHRKVIAVGNEAVGAWVRMGAWCAAHLTDGRVPHAVALTFAPDAAIVASLCDSGLLDKDGDDYCVHDYLKYNPAKRKVLSERKETAARMRKLRGSAPAQPTHNGVSDGVRAGLPSRPVPVPIPFPDQTPRSGSGGWTMQRAGALTSEFLEVWAQFVGIRGESKHQGATAFQVAAEQFAGGQPALRDAILAALTWQRAEFLAREHNKRPTLRTYIEGKRWEDERPAQPKPRPEKITGGCSGCGCDPCHCDLNRQMKEAGWT